MPREPGPFSPNPDHDHEGAHGQDTKVREVVQRCFIQLLTVSRTLTIARHTRGRESRGGATATTTPHCADGCHISAAPLWPQFTSHLLKGQRQRPCSSFKFPTAVQDGTKMGPRGVLTPALPLTSHCPTFIHSCPPSSHAWALQ